MIVNELIKRVITSLVLLPSLFFSLYLSGLYFISFLILIFFLSFYEIVKNTNKLLFIISSSTILILALYSFHFLRGNSDNSLILICWILTATFLSDIGGYTFGRIFKGKKLSKISPNKTYAGSLGSLFFSITALPIINLFQLSFLNENLINFYQLKYLLLTISISVICQLGDLYVSFWKRKIDIKNISNLLPGHGGVLDRIDGLIFVLIFSFVLKNIGLI